MKRTRYTKYTGDLASELGLDDVMQATVDPTVGEWMDECGLLSEAGPSSNGKGKEKARRGKRNPNEDALRDVLVEKTAGGKKRGGDGELHELNSRRSEGHRRPEPEELTL